MIYLRRTNWRDIGSFLLSWFDFYDILLLQGDKNMSKRVINDFSKEYFFLSNFYPSIFEFDDKICYSAESAFQMMKTFDERLRKSIASSIPSIAKAKGRHVRLRKDWEKVKDKIMYEVVMAKFSQNKSLKNALLATGDTELIEGNDWNDTYWGVCNGVGENKLGKILMRVRDELKRR